MCEARARVVCLRTGIVQEEVAVELGKLVESIAVSIGHPGEEAVDRLDNSHCLDEVDTDNHNAADEHTVDRREEVAIPGRWAVEAKHEEYVERSQPFEGWRSMVRRWPWEIE